ncbi:MAG: hypothetical protein LBR80_18350 [Deltaproteobacteria bacterium]|nr:hypothetical protein [Deltaproteobacteria bacterium]
MPPESGNPGHEAISLGHDIRAKTLIPPRLSRQAEAEDGIFPDPRRAAIIIIIIIAAAADGSPHRTGP